MEPIIIELSESRNARSFDKNCLIHFDEFEKARGWINNRIEKIKDKKINKEERFHDTITILGSRGSGKTSFLLSLLDSYKNGKEKDEVEVIDIIDPTLIEEKGHIFLTIISQIADVVEKKLAQSDCDPMSASYQKKKEWRNKLKSLAAGVPSIDGIGGAYETWQDPEFIMDKGLRSVRAAKSLESDFHDLVEFGLKILEKKIFVITLDDIDIDFRKGWPVLETIRKYLTSPLIITLLSGDLKLFSKAIRKQQWKNFGKALMINEGEKLNRMNDYDDLVTEMEGQYLQKVMQPQRRIHLTTLKEKINIYGKELLPVYISKNNEQLNDLIEKNRIYSYYNHILNKFGINNTYQAEAYRSFLLNLPIRTQIQFLTEFESDINNVTDAFLSDLYEKQVNIDTARSNTKYLNTVILKLLIKEKVLDEAYQLQPTTTDSSLNSSLMSLSFLFSQKVYNNPYLIFDYFLRVGYMRNLLSVLGYQENSDKVNISEIKPSIEGLCKHSAIYYDRVYRDILGSMTAYLRAFLNIEKENTISWGGTIPIYAPSDTAKGKGRLSMRIDHVFKEEPLYKRQVACIPVSISQPNDKQQSFTTYSIYVLLAAVGEIIKQVQEGANLDKTLGELSQIRSYAMPAFKYNSISDEIDNDENGEYLEKEDAEKKKDTENKEINLPNCISKWIDSYPKEYVVSPHLLGKISTRLFYAIRNLEATESVSNIGEAMDNRIIILFNTILVEEAREVIKDKPLNNNNPRDNIKIFKDNILNCSKDEIDKLKLFLWIFSNPLFLLYLNDNDNINQIIDYVYYKNNEIVKKILKKSIYLKLKNVEILDINIVQEGHFYYSSTNVKKTVDQLKESQELTYNLFMDGDIETIIPLAKKIFTVNTGDVSKENILKVREHIKKKKIEW